MIILKSMWEGGGREKEDGRDLHDSSEPRTAIDYCGRCSDMFQ